MVRDELWHALRGLRAHLPFAAAAVLITALAIGANTAVFSLVNAVLVSPLPFPDPSRLVEVNGRRPDVDRDPLSLPDYLDLRNFGVVIGDITKPLLVGLAVGVFLSIAGAPALATLLFAVNPIAPATMTAVSAALFVIGLSAAVVGAWRLKSIDPIIALRAE